MSNVPSLRQTYADDLRFFYPETEKERILIEAIQTLAASITYNRPIVTFFESMNPGDQVHLFDNAGVLTARLADAATPRYAFGFVSTTAPVRVGDTGEVTLLGNNLYMTGLIPGETYYLSDTPGTISATAGRNEQFVGVALSNGTLFQNFGTGFAGRFGDVTGPASAINGSLVLFDGVTGKLIKQAIGSGYVKLLSDVVSIQSINDTITELFDNGLAKRASGQRIITTDHTVVASDSGITIFHPASDISTRNIFIPANAGLPLPISTRIRVINEEGAGNVNINVLADDLDWIGNAATGSRTLAPDGWADLEKVKATKWVITGIGLT